MNQEVVVTAQVFYQMFATLIVSGVSVAIAVEVLKSNLIPVQFQKFPRLTALGASIVASVIAVYTSPIKEVVVDTPVEWVAVVAGTLILSAITYNQIFKK